MEGQEEREAASSPAMSSAGEEEEGRAEAKAARKSRFTVWRTSEKARCEAAGGANNIRVAVRIRPFNAREQAEVGNTSAVLQVTDNSIVVDQKHCQVTTYCAKGDKSFTFDHVFSSLEEPSSPGYSSQQKVFEAVGFPILENAFSALNGCLLAYGQTGSGKSYSVLGDTSSEQERGVLPRACETVFEMIAEKREEARLSGERWQATVLVSYLEIYQEKMFDLLVTSGSRADLQVRLHPTLGPHVPQLTECPVKSVAEIEELLDFGSKNRAVSATSMNAQSSRSHAVFSMELRMNLCGREQQSKVHFVDLAGSEKQKKTEAEGARLQEGIAINQSLTTLSRVIMALANASAPEEERSRRKSTAVTPPFRESKLTLLLKEALSGNSRTVLVACVSPSQVNVEESLSTLEFASRCKLIKTSAKKNEQSKKDLIEALSAEKRQIEEQLKLQLEQRKALQEQLEMEALESKRSQEFAERMKEEKLAIERQLREMEQAQAAGPETPGGAKRRTRRLLRSASEHAGAQYEEEEEAKKKRQQALVVQELQQEQERWEEAKGKELEEIRSAHLQFASEVQRLEKEKELQVSQAELERQKALLQLEATKEAQGREREEWLRRQAESERRAKELQEALRQQETDRVERQRLEREQLEVQRELQLAQQEQLACQKETERLRQERERQLLRLEEELERARGQLRDLRERQDLESRRWKELLEEKERQAEALRKARDDAAEEAAQEHRRRVQRLQKEKDEELSLAGEEHRRAVGALQDKLAEMEALERTEKDSAEKARAREAELRQHIELDLRSHETREEELLRELRSIQSLSDSWALERQDLERRAQEQKHDRESLLRELGIMGMDQTAVDSRRSARLVNLHPDPMLEGCLVYYLPHGDTHIGSDKQKCRVWLTGLDVGEVVCAITNQTDRVLSVRALQGGLVRVNGALVSDAGQALQNGDRLAIGRAHIFRVVVPMAAQRGSVLDRRERDFDQAMRELQDCAEIDPRWRRRVDAAVLIVKREFGTLEAKQLLDRAKASSEAIAEANAIVRCLQSPTPPRYELCILFEADSPPLLCVVCRSCAGCEDGLGEAAGMGTPDLTLAAQMAAAEGSATFLAAAPREQPGDGGMGACSAGIWEASRFILERLPYMRWIAEQVRLEADSGELRRQLLSPDDWESRAAAAAAAPSAAASQAGGRAAGLQGEESGGKEGAIWSWWMSMFCTGARGSPPGMRAPPAVDLAR